MQHGSVSTNLPTIPLLTPFLNREGRRGAGGLGRVSRLSFPLSVLVGVLFLLSFSSCHHYRYSERRAQLDSLQRANQADTVFRSDSLQRILADYFDRHGTPDDRMLAHYLLGRAYYDMGETPLALHHYHEAIESADTTDKDCDFRQLGRIHGQTAVLLLEHDAARGALNEFDETIRNSEKGKDTLTMLVAMNRKSGVYERLGLLDSAVINAQRVRTLYDSLGYRQIGAQAMGGVIDILIDKGKLEEARLAIERYETESGLFDGNREIRKGHEIFYHVKALYYLKVGRPDSAIYYESRILMSSLDFNHRSSAYEGLSMAYQQKGLSDSTAKYAILSNVYSDSCQREKAIDDFQKNQAQYDYSRHQQMAAHTIETNQRLKSFLYILAICFITILLLSTVLFLVMKQKRRIVAMKMHELGEKYEALETAYAQLEDLHTLLNEGRKAQPDTILHLMNEKEDDVAKLLHSVTELETSLKKHQKPGKATSRILASTGIKELQTMLAKSPAAMDDRLWEMAKSAVDEALPEFEEAIMHQYPGMRTDDMKICYLTRSQFRTSDIATLLDMKWSTVSTRKKRLCSRLFPDIEATAKGFEGGILTLP